MSKRLLTITTLTGALILAGCGQPGKVTGGGTMHSAGGSDKSVFTFHADSCDEGQVKGSMNLHDSSALDFEDVNGVKLKADVDSTYFCSGDLDFDAPLCACSEGFQEVNFTYQSTNPKTDGGGQGIACLGDFGEKGNSDLKGAAIISISTGPYSGYYNVGTVSGNVQQHSCPAE
ncbi:hypothetical protein [Aliikangiella sp. G2MR2-5]|uniref:hypothetical protein n=1 Tax=Aliikangiella sp. G2MR2-5 TaxID=2788943 RepID=UPI0018AC1462|nr:hypothetical protein [Aliikangiella sp. G2MR2-5]